jgi:hypothetical protein
VVNRMLKRWLRRIHRGKPRSMLLSMVDCLPARWRH